MLGILVKSVIDTRLQNRKMLFEARTKAYAGITGRVFNLFQEPDIHALPDAVKYVRIGEILSEIMLLGSRDLVKLLGEYRVRVFQFHQALSTKDEAAQERLHKELVRLVEQVHTQMRKDLHVDRKSIFDGKSLPPPP
jgi:hypothetical protein